MIGFLGVIMLWVKAGHIIFAIFLVAGLFMIPRFFIYHHQCAVGSDEDRKWIEREDRLRRIILNPSLAVLWILGLLLAVNGGFFAQGWFQAKLVLLVLLSGYHGWTISYCKKLKRGERPFSDKKLRLLNEIPGVLVAIIVVLAVVRL